MTLLPPRHHHHMVRRGHEALLCRCEHGRGPLHVVFPDGKIETHLSKQCVDPECPHRMFDDEEKE